MMGKRLRQSSPYFYTPSKKIPGTSPASLVHEQRIATSYLVLPQAKTFLVYFKEPSLNQQLVLWHADNSSYGQTS